MANEHVNKVIFGDEVLLDLTNDTATAADVAAGKTLHLATGASAVGTASYAGSPDVGGNANKSNAVLYGQVDSTSTSTAFTATVEGLDALEDGTTVLLKNGVVTSASGFTLDVNDLGALPVYSSMTVGNAAPTRDTTIFNIAYALMFIYDSELDEGNGGWMAFRGYDANTNTIGYQLRTNSGRKPAADKGYRYRIWLTSADGASWVPINTSTATDATTSRSLNTRKIDPFGPIAYNSTNGTCNAAANLPAATMWRVYTLSIGYSYVKTLTAWDPVYLKCTPQSDGSAVMADIVQALPSSDDGYIYIHLGTAYSTTAMELQSEHPVYWHDGTGVRLWTGAEPSSGGSTVAVTRSLTSGTKTATLTIDGTGTDLYAPTPPTASTTAPLMDGTASYGSGTAYARSNHVHPTDTSRQATLVSGTNIKTINGNSLLGSGNIAISSPSYDTSDTWTFLRHDGQWADVGRIRSLYSGGSVRNGALIETGASENGGYISIHAYYLDINEGDGWNQYIELGSSGFKYNNKSVATYTTQALTIPVSAWSGTTATVSASAVTASNDVIIAPAPASMSAWAAAGVYCSAQGARTLTFTCSTAPTVALTVNAMIFDPNM